VNELRSLQAREVVVRAQFDQANKDLKPSLQSQLDELVRAIDEMKKKEPELENDYHR